MKKSQPSLCLLSAGGFKKLMKPFSLFVLFAMAVSHVSAQQIQASAMRQIQALVNEKESRTLVQQKIGSQILYETKIRNGQMAAMGLDSLRTGLNVDNNGKLKVTMKATVTPQLLSDLKALGAEIIASSERFSSITASIPLDKMEDAAAFDAVKHVDFWMPLHHSDNMDHSSTNNVPALNNNAPGINQNIFKVDNTRVANIAAPFNATVSPVIKDNIDFSLTRKPNGFQERAANVRKQLTKTLNAPMAANAALTGNVVSEGDVTHKADKARLAFNTDGTGIKIGVISDGVDGYADSQASGDLPATIHILPGQAGSGSEGRAMMEIIHDLAPGADLYFASANPDEATFAQNILDLRSAGCDIIVDDVGYFREAVFQDDDVASSVNSVTASGALYFSAAGNEGNKTDNTSETWEGDFNDAGTNTIGSITIPGGTIHSFGATNYDQVLVAGIVPSLKWADPLGHSSNDYDLYVLNAAMTTVTSSSTNVQNGDDNPEEILFINIAANRRLVIFKKTSAAPRALHLNVTQSTLSVSTDGCIYGHPAAASAYGVAATPASVPFDVAPNPTGPYPGVFNTSNKAEIFSSDGRRRMFYNQDGSAITPNNFLFSTNGGTLLTKPDITAADGVVTNTPGFSPFFGTSAAAPHAAAIAALIKSKIPGITPAQVKAALTSSAIDIEAAGNDRNTGAGIIMAYEALLAAGATPQPSIAASSPVVIVSENATPANNAPDPGETLTVNLPLIDVAGANTSNLVATLLSSGGVTSQSSPQSYGALTSGGPAVSKPFTFTASGACGDNITLTLALQDGALNLGTVSYTLQLGTSALNSSVTFTNTAPITVSTSNVTSPYPSNISVSGLTGKTAKVTVSLNQFTSLYDFNTSVLLVSPTGQKMVIMSDVGGYGQSSNANIVLDDAAATALPIAQTNITSGTYRPASGMGGVAFPSPTPAVPYQYPAPAGTATLASSFNGASPNGTWSLYVTDTYTGVTAAFNGGWSITVSTASTASCAVAPACNNAPVVTNLNDAGAGSLRQAIQNVCAGGTITFQNGLSGTIVLASNLYINKPVTITGPVVTTISVSGGTTTSILDVENSTASPFTVNISGLSFLNGKGPVAGAITHSLTSTASVKLNIAGCSFIGNNFGSTTAQVGAIYSNDSLTIASSTFSSNSLGASDGNATAGAVYANGPFAITGSTFDNNAAGSGNGGGVFGNTVGSITNSTFTKNSALFGGAIYLNNFDATLISSITNCTIVNNSVAGGTGGGMDLNVGKLTMLNNIIAGNTTAGTPGPDVLVTGSQTITSLGHNFIGDSTGSNGFMNGVNGDTLGSTAKPINPLLGSFANYGGTTQTFALLPGSPAINKGGNAGAPATDQRAIARPKQGIVDIGAFESQGFTLTVQSGDGQSADVNTAFASPLKVTVTSSFSEPVNGGKIIFKAPSSGASAAIAGDTAIIVSGTATSGTVTANTIAGAYTVVANASGANAPANFNLINKSTICESPLAQAYISSINVGNQAHRGELALEFHVNNPNGIDIKQLGAFDDNGDGIHGLQPGGGVQVAIFSKTTHQIIPGLDVTIVGNGDTYTGLHQMKNIPKVNLPQGDYLLVAKGYGPNERNGNLGNGGGPYPEGSRGNNDISFLDESAYGPDDPNGFNYPTSAGNFGSNHQFLAGTFAFTTSANCTVSSSADLSNLTISKGVLTPSFATATLSYSDAVDNSVTSVTVTPTGVAGATIKVNGQTVTSGTPSQSIALAEGSNNISVVVTSADATTTKTYTITVVRATSGSCTSAPAQAYVANTSTGNQGYGGELGMEFTVNKASGIIISQLGAFDDGANGIAGTQSGGVRVAIFNRTTHQIVPGLDVTISGSGDALAGNHRMRTITPVTLPAGDYVIVAKGYNSNEKNGNVFSGGGPYPAGNDGSGAISFGLNSSYGPDNASGFNYPTVEANFGSSHIYNAGTFTFSMVVPCGGGTCESSPALAYTSNTNMGSQAYTGELGMEFIVNNVTGINIKQLGAFDDGGNGITGTQSGGVRVAVFNRTTRAIVPGLDVTISGNGDAYTGFHQMKNITPVTLPQGDYMIVAKGYNAAERNGNIFSGGGLFPDGDNGGGAITFGPVTGYGPDNVSGFNYPTTEGNYGNTHVYLAGTFDYTANISCPPPAGNAKFNAITADAGKLSGQSDSAAKAVKVYPNPTRGQFNLQLTNVIAPKLDIQIINANGQLVDQKVVQVPAATALMIVQFNLLHAPNGIYLVKVTGSDGIRTEKVIIQR